jgi:sterol desaturase/sphingolipid hydroxylase (fatty acid hydroxylase superfamily)
MSLSDLALGIATYLYRALVAHVVNGDVSFIAALTGFPLFVVGDLIVAKARGRQPLVRLTRPVLVSTGASMAIYLLNNVCYPVLELGIHALDALWASLHVPHLPRSAWASVPRPLVVVAGIVLSDFMNYWTHRAMHSKWLWPTHAIHHSDPVVTPATALRVHSLQLLFMASAYIVPVSLLGLPTEDAVLIALLINTHNQYVHLDVDWAHGKLWWLIVSPRYHRWHHSDVAEAQGKNISNVLPIWDILFKTHHEDGPFRGRLGAEGVPEHDVVKLMLFPFFEWGRMVAARVRAPRTAR